MALPRSLDELGGLRAARWIRESTAGQSDNFGPDAQRDQQDRAIERYGLRDTGIAWDVAHSGRTVAGTDTFRSMLAAAGREYDVLVVGYVSRFARDLRAAVNARHDLHGAGAALLFADERLLSSDEDRWEEWARDAVEAESYSRKLGKRITEGYAAKFRRLSDQGGSAPYGFRRRGEKPHTLEIDPDRIGLAVQVFELYAANVKSFEAIGIELGIPSEQARCIASNPIYNGWMRRHRDSPREERMPAPWRANPPVPDELWHRVQDVRAERTRGGGPHGGPPDPIAGLLHCVCGKHIRGDGWGGNGKRRRSHPDPTCGEWGPRRSYWT